MRGQPIDRLPNIAITMMKAADEIRVPYKSYALDAEAHARGQLAVSRAFAVDHVSGISDPAVEASDLGAAVIYRDDAPPAVDDGDNLLADPARLARLKVPDPWAGPRMRKRIDAVALMKKGVDGQAVEGWIEGPIAEACDLRGISTLMTDFFDAPGFVRDLFSFVLETGIAFARAQIEAGADYMGVGDAAASLVGPDIYREFVWEYERKLVDELHRMGVPVRLHICGNITPLLPLLSDVKADILDLDSMVSVGAARQALGPERCLAGNINPVSVLRDGTPAIVAARLEECFSEAGRGWYAVAAGCEVPRDTPAANLHSLARFAAAHQSGKAGPG